MDRRGVCNDARKDIYRKRVERESEYRQSIRRRAEYGQSNNDNNLNQPIGDLHDVDVNLDCNCASEEFETIGGSGGFSLETYAAIPTSKIQIGQAPETLNVTQPDAQSLDGVVIESKRMRKKINLQKSNFDNNLNQPIGDLHDVHVNLDCNCASEEFETIGGSGGFSLETYAAIPTSKIQIGQAPETLNVTQPDAQSHDGVVIESKRMRNKINLQKSNFATTRSVLNIGYPEQVCRHCYAVMWKNEHTITQQKNNTLGFSLCCSDGKVQLPSLRETPTDLLQLLDGEGQLANAFRTNIRLYNNIFAFTSMGGTIDKNLNNGGGPYVFRLQGQTFHRMGSLLPVEGKKPMYAQLYMFDSHEDLQRRLNFPTTEGSLDSIIVSTLTNMLDRDNELVKIFRQARDRFAETDYINVNLRLIANRQTDGRESNIPTNAHEFAGLIPNDNLLTSRDIIVDYKDTGLRRISDVHPSFMALQYPLLFPYGEDGFRPNILHRGLTIRNPVKKQTVSMREYYAYRIQHREGEGHSLIKGGRLFLQFVVDAWACIEHERLSWVLRNQTALRTDVYNNIVDSVNKGDTEAINVGKRIVLPATFTGSPRYMQQNYQDCMAVCRRFGNPDLFITFTCNPKWPEISYFLERTPKLEPSIRPDIVSRVFKIKVDLLLDDLTKNHIFGRVIAVAYTIEFQKRGLPHVHMIIWLAEPDKCHTTAIIDKIICAEIPDKETDPHGYEAVAQFMVHGPCGPCNPNTSCMQNKKCSKHFPKKFASATIIDDSGFPIYQRRDNGRTITRNGVKIDNRFIVPYNCSLIVKYQAHINIELCNKGRLIKYLFKYLSKGPDRATMTIEPQGSNNHHLQDQPQPAERRDNDEVHTYLSCRYISSSEACWRIFEFTIHYRKSVVARLYFHLENKQEVQFRENETLPSVLRRTDPNGTMFIQWMHANMQFEEGRHLTFVEFPEKFLWNKNAKMWELRKRATTNIVGRMVYAHPASGERFYLRLLLNVVRGATSFEEIRTVEGVIYATYKEACYHRGLLQSDNEWHSALCEASLYQTGKQLRELFVTLLLFCDISNVLDLWNNHWESLSDDILYMQRHICGMPQLVLPAKRLQSLALYEIDLQLRKNGKSLSDFPSLPSLDHDLIQQCKNRLLYEEFLYDRVALAEESSQYISKLNEKQRLVYEAVINSVKMNIGGLFFVYGHGGTGKTFLWKTIIAKLRSCGNIVLAVASSGIASLLIQGGRTAHSRFKIPLNIDENSSCDIKQNTMLAELICRTDLVVWDEAPMNHRYVFEAVDRSFRDMMQKIDQLSVDKPFGGKTVLLGGDFRQILPVLPRMGREDIVMASINQSYLWKHCKVFKLDTNMRLEANIPPITIANQIVPFAKWVINIGDGREPAITIGTDDDSNWVQIPQELSIPAHTQGIQEMINTLFSDLLINYSEPSYIRDRAILTPMNEDVHSINKLILDRLPGEPHVYYSCDSICKSTINYEAQESMYPPEFLNSLKFNGIPNHELELKVGAPIILLRNLNPSKGLCNGTRLIITQLCKRIIEAKIVTGSNIGDKAFIPRINMCPTDSTLPFVFNRLHFPVALCYAMTINKSQGQTLKHVGLYLPKPVFSHGQFYVAISRVTSPLGLKILCEHSTHPLNGFTKNVVYQEVFNNL